MTDKFAKIKKKARQALQDFNDGETGQNPALLIAAMVDQYPNSNIDWQSILKQEAFCEQVVSESEYLASQNSSKTTHKTI